MDLEHFGTMHDNLTGIYNKYGFYRQARRVMEENPGISYLMVCLNFGDFKLLNGLYGMTKGNELLMRVGSMLRRHYGTDARTAYGRIRADRFAMLIPEAIFDPDAYLKTVETIMHGLAAIHFDLQIAADSRRVIGAEALSRWVCDDGRVIPPAMFIPILEEHGKVWQLDYRKRRKTPPFRAGDIRRVRRICVSN